MPMTKRWSGAAAAEAMANGGPGGHPAVPLKPVLDLEVCLMVVLTSPEAGRSDCA
jgi:hypothetical protein